MNDIKTIAAASAAVPKRSPHQAALTRESVNVLARNMRAILVEAHGWDAAAFRHRHAVDLVARCAGFTNAQHLAANYKADTDVAKTMEARRTVAERAPQPILSGATTEDSPRAGSGQRHVLIVTPEDVRSLRGWADHQDPAFATYGCASIAFSPERGWVDPPKQEDTLSTDLAVEVQRFVGDDRFIIFDRPSLDRLNACLAAVDATPLAVQQAVFLQDRAEGVGEVWSDSILDIGYFGAACLDVPDDPTSITAEYAVLWVVEILTCILGVEYQMKLFGDDLVRKKGDAADGQFRFDAEAHARRYAGGANYGLDAIMHAVKAATIAQTMGHGRADELHVLASLLRDPHGLAASLIREGGGDPVAAERMAESMLAKRPASFEASADPGGMDLLQRAVRFRGYPDKGPVRSEHLLLLGLGERGSVGRKVLSASGASLYRVVRATTEALRPAKGTGQATVLSSI